MVSNELDQFRESRNMHIRSSDPFLRQIPQIEALFRADHERVRKLGNKIVHFDDGFFVAVKIEVQHWLFQAVDQFESLEVIKTTRNLVLELGQQQISKMWLLVDGRNPRFVLSDILEDHGLSDAFQQLF